VHVVACDVGQGDATLITYGFTQMLVDGGVDGSLVTTCLDEHLPWGDTTIEVVVATHADADHIGGLTSVLERFTVSTLLINGEKKETDVFSQFSSLVQSKESQGMQVVIPGMGDSWRIGDRLLVSSLFSQVETCANIPLSTLRSETTLQDSLCNSEGSSKSSNDLSIVLNVNFDSISVLLMGDLETEGEESLLIQGLLGKTTIIKAGHHGAKTSSSPHFVSATLPEIAMISSGKNNRFGHPSPEVVSRYDAVNSTVLRTDQAGTIELLSDGDRVWKK